MSDTSTSVDVAPSEAPPPIAESVSSEQPVVAAPDKGVEGASPSEKAEPAKAAKETKEAPVEDKDWKTAKELKAASYKKFEEAAAYRKEAEAKLGQVQQFFEALNKDPRNVLKAVLKDRLREVAIQELQEEMEMDQLSPEQRELRQYKQQVAQMEQHRAAQAAEQEQAEMGKQVEHFRNVHGQKILSALNEAGLKDSPTAVKRMANTIRQAIQGGYDVDHQELAGLVKQELQAEHKDLYGKMDGAALADLLGQENVQKLLKHSLTLGKATPGSLNSPPPPGRDGMPPPNTYNVPGVSIDKRGNLQFKDRDAHSAWIRALPKDEEN